MSMNSVPLSHAQKRIWFVEKITGMPVVNNIGGTLVINGVINPSVMQAVLNDILRENDALRIQIYEENGEPRQRVARYQRQEIKVVDFSSDLLETPQAWMDDIFRQEISLESDKLYQFFIFMVGDGKSGVLMKLHHIIADGWSTSLVQEHICIKYEKYLAGDKTEEGGEREYSYTDYVYEEEAYLSSEKAEINRQYWVNQFQGLPQESLYCTTENVKGNRLTFGMEQNLSTRIKGYLAETQESVFTLFISAVLLYVHLTTHRDDIVLGIPVHNRIGIRRKKLIGMCTSTMPIRFQVNGSVSIKELLRTITDGMRSGFRNQSYPYDLLIKELNIGQDGYDSLFRINVNYYNRSVNNKIGTMACKTEEHYFGFQNHSMQIVINKWDQELFLLNYDYKEEEYNEHAIRYMNRKILYIIEQILDGAQSVSQIRLHTIQEETQQLYTFNDTDSTLPSKTVVGLFDDHVVDNPENVALYFGEQVFTYRQVQDSINQVACCLVENGVGAGSVVAIRLTHSPELFYAIFGTLKTGAAYLPIDIDCPSKRMQFMLKDCKCQFMITDHPITAEAFRVLQIDEILRCGLYAEVCADKSDMSGVAYVIYTSGTTGNPKGVAISHLGLLNYIWWAQKTYLEKNDVMAVYSSIAFDLTVTSIFTPLISGNAADIYQNGETDHAIFSIIARNRANVVKITPAHLHLLKGKLGASTRIDKLIVGGEALKANLAEDISNTSGGLIKIFNEYGPTEAVVGCMIHQYDPATDRGQNVPIGVPIQNMKIYLLNDKLSMIPYGGEGEICISGRGLAHYLHYEGAAGKFVRNPFCEQLDLYRSGDLGRFREDGLIEFIGRKDQQVKIRGYRIELSEVEKCLLGYTGISDVVVHVDGVDENKSIVAYVVCDELLDEMSLRSYMNESLPHYMIPQSFHRITHIPLTRNGKIDYASLPAPRTKHHTIKPAQTETEKILASAIQEIMGEKDVNVQASFYELGGDSIKAIQVASALRKYGYKLKSAYLLRDITLQEAAAKMEAASGSALRYDPSNGSIKIPPIIHYFLSEYHDNLNYYDQYVALQTMQDYTISDLGKALHQLVTHHDALRLNYDADRQALYYNDSHLEKQVTVEEINLGYDVTDNKADIHALAQKIRIDHSINDDLLLRIYVVNQRHESCFLLFVAHHLIIDSVSWQIILSDFFRILDGLTHDKLVVLEKTDSYGHWCEAVDQYDYPNLPEQIEYWNRIHAIGAGSSMSARPSLQWKVRRSISIDKNMVKNAKQACNTTMRMSIDEFFTITLVLTVFTALGRDDALLFLENNGRNVAEESVDVSRTVGWFTNMYPAYFRNISGDLRETVLSLKEQLRTVQQIGVTYGVLRYLRKLLTDDLNQYIRYNYLGDIQSALQQEGKAFSVRGFGLLQSGNPGSIAIDIVARIENGVFQLDVDSADDEKVKRYANIICDTYAEVFASMLRLSEEPDTSLVSPSDFLEVELSDEDVRSLFR